MSFCEPCSTYDFQYIRPWINHQEAALRICSTEKLRKGLKRSAESWKILNKWLMWSMNRPTFSLPWIAECCHLGSSERVPLVTSFGRFNLLADELWTSWASYIFGLSRSYVGSESLELLSSLETEKTEFAEDERMYGGGSNPPETLISFADKDIPQWQPKANS